MGKKTQKNFLKTMKNLSLFCISLNPDHLEKIKYLNYTPVGLGEKSFSNEWSKDSTGINISEKNKFFGEYTFHYWIWKNHKDLIQNNWIGFCQYRKFWSLNSLENKCHSIESLNKITIKEIPKYLENFESILGDNLYVNKFRFTKFIKKNFKKMIFSPSLFLNKNKRNIKFHFDMMHGDGNLNKAIDLLDVKEKKDFKNFVTNNVSYNPHNMFICKSKKILNDYYDSIFPWLFRCESLFNDDELRGYGLQRIYGFLAERYLSYWFRKYTNFTTLPIIHEDISNLIYKP